ncbi:hypothetical protein Mapa_001720 [Marchantia paleacea]|nr:hypothetical protein Mapa_001720 [Marchantia paleacea]
MSSVTSTEDSSQMEHTDANLETTLYCEGEASREGSSHVDDVNDAGKVFETSEVKCVEATGAPRKKPNIFARFLVTTGLILCAAPIAVPAVVAALGFTSAGIAAGSAAAGFMASYGGAVSAGSVCAVLQSIGATGTFA